MHTRERGLKPWGSISSVVTIKPPPLWRLVLHGFSHILLLLVIPPKTYAWKKEHTKMLKQKYLYDLQI